MKYGQWLAVPSSFFKYELIRNVYLDEPFATLYQEKYPSTFWFFKNAKAKAKALNRER